MQILSDESPSLPLETYQRNIALDLILTLLLCGLWNMVVQYQQIKMLNVLLKEGRFSYWKISLLTLVTCGIYFIFFEYKKAKALAEITHIHDDSDEILAIVLSFVGLNFVWDAIFQSRINTFLVLQARLSPNNTTDLI